MTHGFRKASGRPREDAGPESPFTQHQIQSLVKVEFDRARRHGYSLCVMIVRIDRLETLADLHGHQTRDLILGTVARLIRKESRSSDLLGRHPEDRWLLLLPHTDLDGAFVVAQRIRRRVAEFAVKAGDKVFNITLSLGLAHYSERNALFCDAVVQRAERAAEVARRLGGNRVETAVVGPPDTGLDEPPARGGLDPGRQRKA